MDGRAKNAHIHLKINDELKEKVRVEARKYDMTISDYIRSLLKKEMEKKK